MARKELDLARCDLPELHGLADTGNADALSLLREQYRCNPEIPLLLGDLAAKARDLRVKQMVGNQSSGTALSILEKMKDVEKKMAGDNPTPLERLLAERIAMCWLDVQDHEIQYAMLGENTPNRYEWRSRMLDRAHNRYLTAIKALANIRRLHLSLVQVNIANTVGRETSINNDRMNECFETPDSSHSSDISMDH